MLLIISMLVFACEMEEPAMEPYRPDSSEARMKEFVETELDTFEYKISSIIVCQRQISEYSVKLQVAEDENTYINMLPVEQGIRFYIVRFEGREDLVDAYYYAYKNIRGIQVNWGHPDAPEDVKLSITLTEPFNWKN